VASTGVRLPRVVPWNPCTIVDWNVRVRHIPVGRLWPAVLTGSSSRREAQGLRSAGYERVVLQAKGVWVATDRAVDAGCSAIWEPSVRPPANPHRALASIPSNSSKGRLEWPIVIMSRGPPQPGPARRTASGFAARVPYGALLRVTGLARAIDRAARSSLPVCACVGRPRPAAA
jgi:hypothetical protein